MIDGRLPTVPEYYSEFIDSSVDLTMTPKQCCPFHHETAPSFSYNIVTGRWSCFGKCHAHGDVIEMHKRWFHFNTREEAESDLSAKCHIPKKSPIEVIQSMRDPIVHEDKVEDEAVYNKACMLANCPERWIQLDYVMSKTPFDRIAVQSLIYEWTGVKSVLD